MNLHDVSSVGEEILDFGEDFGLCYDFAVNLHDVGSVGEEAERHAQGISGHGITARPDIIIL